MQKLKQTGVNDIKLFEAKVVGVKNSMSKILVEKNEFLVANQLQEGQLESGLTQRVFSLPKYLQDIALKVRDIKHFRKCLDNFYKMTLYLNGDEEDVV